MNRCINNIDYVSFNSILGLINVEWSLFLIIESFQTDYVLVAFSATFLQNTSFITLSLNVIANYLIN